MNTIADDSASNEGCEEASEIILGEVSKDTKGTIIGPPESGITNRFP